MSFDAHGFPEAATGAILVANKIFWTLGYWQVENFLIRVQLDQLVVADIGDGTAAVRQGTPDADRATSRTCCSRAHRSADGSYRAVAARAVPGRPLGGFRYHGTRPDDPNDIVPHEHRRELRALKVFGAWTNLTDMKAGNTLDTLITTAGGRGTVRHYLQDVGSTFGTGANRAARLRRRLGVAVRRRSGVEAPVYAGLLHPAVADRAVRDECRDRPVRGGRRSTRRSGSRACPPRRVLRARADDTFWAARRVMAFSDEMIRALVKTGQYSDPQAEALLATVLIQRRDKIGRAYLPPINPVVDVALNDSGVLTFENAAVAAGVAPAPAGGYLIHWARFDNNTGAATGELGTSTATAAGQSQAPVALPVAAGSYIKVEIRAVQPVNPAWGVPVAAYFRRSGGWKLVGLDRIP